MFFECEYRHERFIGFDKPSSGESLRLYRLADAEVHAGLVATGDPAAFIAAIMEGRAEVVVPADAQDELRLLPPLLPAALGEAMVSGFMQTHNVKISGGAKRDDDAQAHPNWFFKGLGSSLHVAGDPLTVPASAVAVCEEAEVVLVHIADAEGTPRYVGYTFGNDLTDIGRFKRNPGHLSYAKLCDASVSSWFFFGEPPRSVTGQVTIERGGATVWEGTFQTGVESMRYRLEDMMEHLFSYPALRQPGCVHYVFIGADRSSYHGGFRIAHGDRISINVASHDVVLSNVVRWAGRTTAI